MQTPINLQRAEELVTSLGFDSSKLIGQGGEGWIFEYTDDKVIKVYNDGKEKYLNSLALFQNYLSGTANFPFALPQIFVIKQTEDGVFYTIEKRLYGSQLDAIFPSLEEEKQFQVLESYFQSVLDFGKFHLPQYDFGNILDTQEKITAKDWIGFLIAKLKQRSILSKTRMKQEVNNYEEKTKWLEEIIKTNLQSNEKSLVHGDYYFNNVLVDNSLQISAILDLSQHLVVGDPKIDIAGAIAFLGINPNVTTKHYNFLYIMAEKQFGEDINKYINIYTLYYSFYYCYLYRTDLNSHEWVVRNLNNEKLWVELKIK